MLLVAAGRIPNGDLLDLDEGGHRRPTGTAACSSTTSSARPSTGVFALGDASSPFQLKHVANHEAKVVQHNLAAPGLAARAPTTGSCRPRCSPTRRSPSVGRTEAQCRAMGLDYVVKIQEYGDVAYGWAMEDDTGFCKLIADRGTGTAARRAHHGRAGVAR